MIRDGIRDRKEKYKEGYCLYICISAGVYACSTTTKVKIYVRNKTYLVGCRLELGSSQSGSGDG